MHSFTSGVAQWSSMRVYLPAIVLNDIQLIESSLYKITNWELCMLSITDSVNVNLPIADCCTIVDYVAWTYNVFGSLSHYLYTSLTFA